MNQAEAVYTCPETYEEVLVNTVRVPKMEAFICGKKIFLLTIAENTNWLEQLNHLDLDHHDLTSTTTTTPTTTMPFKKSCFKSAIKATAAFSYCQTTNSTSSSSRSSSQRKVRFED